MKAKLFGNRHPYLIHAATNLIVRAVKRGVPINATIQNPDELRRQGVAEGEASAAVGHGIGMHHVLLHALGIPADVIHLLVIISIQQIH